MHTTQLQKEDKLLRVHEDDMERFFPTRAWKVPAAQVWRWRAACQALRELDEE